MATLSANGSLAPPPEVQEQINGIMQQEEAKGSAPVHHFDPDATSEEKAAVAGKEVDKLKSIIQDGTPERNKELPVDTGASDIVPTITIEDVDKAAAAEKEAAQKPQSQHPEMPGTMPAVSAPEIPDWYKIGWRAVSGIDAPTVDGPAKDKLILDAFLKEQFYGEWYHSAAVIVFAVIATHFLTRFNFGWGWLFIVLAFTATYYRTSVARFRRNARDDIQRELVKTRLMSDSESADWMNHFLDRFWLIYEPVLSRTITATVEQVLSTNCPPFLESMRLTDFTLGSKAPRIESVRTFPKTEEDIVMMDWDFSFNPNDISDLTQKQIKKLSNPKIVLSIRLGKGLATAAMPILVENMSFAGSMRVRMKLMTNFPHVQVVDISFLKPPEFDFVLKPIGGETFGFDIAGIPGLSSFIRETVHSVLQPMMYEPNVFTLNLEQLLSGQPIDSAVGVVQVTVHSARGLKGSKLGGGTPDPYVSMNINNRAELAKTKYKNSTVNPSWSETKFLLVNSLTETLVLSILDYNEHRKHTDLGAASFNLADLNDDATQEGIEKVVFKDGKDRGKLNFDVSFFPVLKPEAGQGGLEVIPDTKVGIVRLTIHQAKDLDNSKSLSGDLNPFCRLYLGSSKTHIHATRKLKHTNNPVWESSTEFLCSDKSSSLLVLRVIDDRDFLKDPIVGYLSARLEDLLEARKEAGRDWWPLSGCKSGKLRISAEWKPLNMAGSLHGVDQYVPPIGVVRLWLKKATDVKNVEAALGGKSDPYVRVQINNITQGRTEVVNNNLSPEWDQIIYIPVHSLKETMMLECMDYQHLTKDRTLGYVELKVSSLAQASEGDSPYVSSGKRIAEDPIKQDKGTTKGQLHYEAEFIPAILLKDVSFHGGLNELKRAKLGSGGGSEDGGTVDSSDASSISSSEMEETNHAVPTVSAPMPDKSRGHQATTSNDSSRTAGPLPPSDDKEAQGSTDSKEESSGDAKTDSDKESDNASQNSGPGVRIGKEDLLTHQSGIIIFNVLRGQLHKKARLEVLLDDGYWPAFSTSRARSYHAEWEHLGEGFVKELDFSRVWLRLNEADEGDKDDIVAEWNGETKSFLERALGEPYTFTLTDKDDLEKKSTIVVEARYVPVPVTLEPRESVNNQGTLRVELLDGNEIHGVDRGGKSDPFTVFELNGQRVFKSQTKKKTLNPEWNETFTTQVPSRVAAKFSLEVFDWNQIEQAKSLGFGKIDLSALEPFVSEERTISLTSGKHGDKGTVRIRLVFTPEIIAKSRKSTSTFSTAGRAMTQIGHLPIGAGRGVAHGVTGIFKRDHAKPGPVSELEEAVPPSPTTTTAATDKRSIASLRSKPSLPQVGPNAEGVVAKSNGGGSPEPGTLRVTVVDGKELASSDVKPYVVVRVGEKEFKTKHVHKTANPEWNETFYFAAGPSQTKVYVWLYDNKNFSKDKMLGLGDVDIWGQLTTGTASQVEVAVNLREGHGTIRLRLEFDPDNKLPRPSLSTLSLTGSPASPSRFSLSTMSRRKGLASSGDD